MMKNKTELVEYYQEDVKPYLEEKFPEYSDFVGAYFGWKKLFIQAHEKELVSKKEKIPQLAFENARLEFKISKDNTSILKKLWFCITHLKIFTKYK